MMAVFKLPEGYVSRLIPSLGNFGGEVKMAKERPLGCPGIP
jgi:hypothetical protein